MMPEWPLIQFAVNLGSWALALVALAWLWLHNRDDIAVHKRVTDLESDMEAIEKIAASQETAFRLSALADKEINERLAEMKGLLSAVSARVDTIDRNGVELRTEVRHLTQQVEHRRERS